MVYVQKKEVWLLMYQAKKRAVPSLSLKVTVGEEAAVRCFVWVCELGPNCNGL